MPEVVKKEAGKRQRLCTEISDQAKDTSAEKAEAFKATTTA